VLRLEPRSEAALDLQAIDAGKLLHDILRRFFEGHRHQYLPASERDQLRREMAKVADDVFKEHERMVPPLNQRIWKIDCEIRKLILDQVLLYELRLQEKTNDRGIRPAYFELAFGRASQASDPGSSPDYLKLPRAGGDGAETALLQGQIDRVDINERERVAVAYDYKLSQGAKLEDIETGRQVQIPIYLAALEQLFLPGYALAGGGYYRLRGSASRLNQGLYRLTFADCTNVGATICGGKRSRKSHTSPTYSARSSMRTSPASATTAACWRSAVTTRCRSPPRCRRTRRSRSTTRSSPCSSPATSRRSSISVASVSSSRATPVSGWASRS
jgi:hypothetical protein